MNERHKILSGVMAMGFALTHVACSPREDINSIPAESCPPATLAEVNQNGARWLSMNIEAGPFIFPLSIADPANPDNQARVSIEKIVPNEGVSVSVQMPNEEPMVGFIENDPSAALRFAQEIDLGMQFWACEANDSAFFRLVPLALPIPNDNA